MSSEARNILRGALLSGSHLARKRYPLDFFGQKIEIVQPSVSDVAKLSEGRTAGEVNISLVDVLIDYAYVPGTNEKVFEVGDKDILKELPFGPEMTALSELLSELYGGSIKEKEKN